MDEIHFTEATRKLVDAPYVLGNPSKGYDCLSMLYAIYDDALPREWHGWTLQNYAERWSKGEGRKELAEFVCGLGISIDPNFMRKGDIIIFGWSDASKGPGIYLGNDHVLAVLTSEIGVNGTRVIPIRKLKPLIFAVRRIVLCR
jgi:cell wall-associated NlpC family hydrolase